LIAEIFPMSSYRFPVLVWEDYAGRFTARPVELHVWPEYAPLVTVEGSARGAVARLKDILEWALARTPWLPAPDFNDPKVFSYHVALRPEYHTHERSYPCEEVFPLTITGVSGKRSDGLQLASVPRLGLHFGFHEAQSLKQLVTEAVQQNLRGLTPSELVEHLAPVHFQLDEITIRAPEQARQRGPEWKLSEVASVAEPLADRTARKRFARAWQREKQIQALLRSVTQERANVLLVGESGVGKTTLLVETLSELAKVMEKPAENRDQAAARSGRSESGGNAVRTSAAPIGQRFWLTSGARLIAGMQYLGQWEERLERIIAELQEVQGYLCVENLLDLVRTGGRTPQDGLAAFLTPYLQRGEFRMIGEITPSEMEACRRLLPGFVDLFQLLPVPEFDRADALEILARLSSALSTQRDIPILPEVPEQVYRLFRRFLPYQVFPGPAARFLHEQTAWAAREGFPQVDADLVIDRFVQQTGIPDKFLRDDVFLQAEEITNFFHERVRGQAGPCQVAAQQIAVFKAGLNDPRRPLAVLLFTGPTGVGKTELARTLADYLFGAGERKDRLVRLDMSEFAGYGASDRFLGDSLGEPSAWIQQIRQQPFSVVLFDEIEKAAPEIFDVLLGLCDEGRLTDRFGRVTNFRSALVLFTSNLGAQSQRSLGFGEQPGPAYDQAAQKFFRPEFYNRLDSVVQFQPLAFETILEITRKELQEIASRDGLARSGCRIVWTEPLVAALARAGYDARYGARPLQRTIETQVVAPLAQYLLQHPEGRGKQLLLDWSSADALTIRPGP